MFDTRLSIHLSVHTWGGGVPQPGPGGGVPRRGEYHGYPPVRPGQGVPWQGCTLGTPPSDLVRGGVYPTGGYPDVGTPTGGTLMGLPCQGVPQWEYPRYPSTIRPGWGYPNRGVPWWGGTPPSGTWYAAVGMPLAFTQEDFLVGYISGDVCPEFKEKEI